MNEVKTHLFICTNGPDKEGKCGSKNSEQMRRALKERCATEPWAKEVRINSAGCLGQCEHGIATVMYPEGKWHLDLKSSDGELLYQDVKKAAEKSK